MDAPKYRVFISSTTEDLKEYRAAAAAAVQELGHEPAMLEFYAATESSPIALSRQTIASSDVFISLIAWRYGYIPTADNPNQYSFVELELRHAWDLGIPTLVFMVGDDSPWPRKFIDDGPAFDRLNAFRKHVLDRAVVAFFGSPEDLSQKIMTALARWQVESRRPQPSFDELVIPPSVDPFELAWRLVVDFKAEPALLLSMDSAELLRATQTWAGEADVDQQPGPGLFESAQAHLRTKQSTLAPNPLWLAWKRATASGPAKPQSDGRLTA